MRSSNSALMVIAMIIGEALAGPTHAHLHRHAHAKKDVDWESLDWDNMGIDWAAAYAAGQASKSAAAATPVATPASTPASSPAQTPAATPVQDSTSSGSSSGAVSDVAASVANDVSALFDSVVGASNSLTSFGLASTSSGSTGDYYMGNIGNPWGSNMIKVSSAEGNQFTNTFVNSQSVAITVSIWNKVGSDKQPLSGSANAPHDPALTFVLPAGAQQVVAFMDDSQVAWAESCSERTASGAFGITWGEANFVSTGSGYDMTAIPNPSGNNYNMKLSSTEVTCISDPTQNYWLTASQPIGTSDGSCYIPSSTVTLTTVMGGTM